MLWSVEKDNNYPVGYFIYSGTREDPLERLRTHVLTLWGARFWIWRESRKIQGPRSRIVFQVEVESNWRVSPSPIRGV